MLQTTKTLLNNKIIKLPKEFLKAIMVILHHHIRSV